MLAGRRGLSKDLVARAERSIEYLRNPPSPLAPIPGTVRQAIADVIVDLLIEARIMAMSDEEVCAESGLQHGSAAAPKPKP